MGDWGFEAKGEMEGEGRRVPVETTRFVEEFEVEGGCCLAVYLWGRGGHGGSGWSLREGF